MFPEPVGLFLQHLASPAGHHITTFPRHYFEQFHKTYNPAVDQLAKEAGFDKWVDLLLDKTYHWGERNPDLPTLGAWRLVTPLDSEQRAEFERNPYYWKVDPDGRQLPYLDRVTFDIVSDPETALLQLSNGDYNFEAGPNTRVTTTANKPVLAGSRQDGGYRFVDVLDAHMNNMCIYLNMTHEDEVKRGIIQDKNFRIGLSHAINRQEIIDAAMQRQGEPYQAAPLPESAFYDEEFATQYLEYDTDKANAFLDEAIPDKDDQGRRLGSDGSVVRLTIEYALNLSPEWATMLDLIKGYWGAVGVEVELRSEDRTLWNTRTATNKHDGTVWQGSGGLDPMLSPFNYLPVISQSYYAKAWLNWWHGPDGPEPKLEPPAATQRQMDLYRQLQATVDAADQTALMQEILQISKEQFYVIGVARAKGVYFVAADDFRNVPDTMIKYWQYGTPGPTHPEQYFIK